MGQFNQKKGAVAVGFGLGGAGWVPGQVGLGGGGWLPGWGFGANANMGAGLGCAWRRLAAWFGWRELVA